MRKFLPYISLVPLLISGCSNPTDSFKTQDSNQSIESEVQKEQIDFEYFLSIAPEQPQTYDTSCSDSSLTPKKVYEPHSCDAVLLFSQAAKRVGVPVEWSNSSALHEILDLESDGIVGIPNYSIKTDTGKTARFHPSSWKKIRDQIKRKDRVPNTEHTRTTAMGLGQLTKENMDKYSPNGFNDIGNALLEAQAMLLYIDDRYGSPEQALAFHNKKNWY